MVLFINMILYSLFILGFFFLIKGADLLVDGASSVAKRFNISNIVIGLTIVAFGTSMPELIVNIFSSINGNTELAISNILGSNIANILLILGIASIIYPLRAQSNTVLKEIPFSLLAALVLFFLVSDVKIDGESLAIISRTDGFILLSFFMIFLYYTFSIIKNNNQNNNQDNNDDKEIEEGVKIFSLSKSILFIFLGLLGLTVGGKWIVDGAIFIADSFNISQSLIGITVIAIGTSLPELATSAIAAYKKQSDIAIGNVVGSNIFNIFWILGLSSVIRPIPFNFSSDKDIWVTIIASILLFTFMFIGKKHIIERWQGVLMVILYIAYILLSIFVF